MTGPSNSRREGGFTLIEVIVAMMIATIIMTGIVSAFMQMHRQAEWAAYSLAAQSLAMQPLEQARAAKWDPNAYPPCDEVVPSNFPPRIEVLDVPICGTNIVSATNTTTIHTVSSSPPLKEIKVECVWSFPQRGLFTNSIITYRAPDQ